MLQKEVLVPSTPEKSEFVSPIFTVPKPDGGIKLILNLKEPNTYVKYLHFKMETIKAVLQNITQGCFMTSFDLKDAYFSVKINDDYRNILNSGGKIFCTNSRAIQMG